MTEYVPKLVKLFSFSLRFSLTLFVDSLILLSMRRIAKKSSAQTDGTVLFQTIVVAHSINLKTVEQVLGIRAESFYNQVEQIELLLSKPTIQVCDTDAVRKLAGAKQGEKVFIINQIHSERFI